MPMVTSLLPSELNSLIFWIPLVLWGLFSLLSSFGFFLRRKRTAARTTKALTALPELPHQDVEHLRFRIPHSELSFEDEVNMLGEAVVRQLRLEIFYLAMSLRSRQIPIIGAWATENGMVLRFADGTNLGFVDLVEPGNLDLKLDDFKAFAGRVETVVHSDRCIVSDAQLTSAFIAVSLSSYSFTDITIVAASGAVQLA